MSLKGPGLSGPEPRKPTPLVGAEDAPTARLGTATAGKPGKKAMEALAGPLVAAMPVRDLSAYAPVPDFRKDPLAFIENPNGWADRTILKNGWWIEQDKYPEKGKKGWWSVYEPGGDPSGCAARRGCVRKKVDAILIALDGKPFEHPADVKVRIEAAAREGSMPGIEEVVDDLFDQCRSMLGALKEETREGIKAYLCNPTVENWEPIAGAIMAGNFRTTTLWQLWGELVPAAPRSGRSETMEGLIVNEWSRIPTPLEVLTVIREASALVVNRDETQNLPVVTRRFRAHELDALGLELGEFTFRLVQKPRSE